jgi:hypothetical protein
MKKPILMLCKSNGVSKENELQNAEFETASIRVQKEKKHSGSDTSNRQSRLIDVHCMNSRANNMNGPKNTFEAV